MDLKYTQQDYRKANIHRVNVRFERKTKVGQLDSLDSWTEYHYYSDIDELKEELANHCLFKGYDSFEILLPSNIPY